MEKYYLCVMKTEKEILEAVAINYLKNENGIKNNR
jgi:hypothetical protein